MMLLQQLLQILNQNFYAIPLDINTLSKFIVSARLPTRIQPVRDPHQHFYQFFDIQARRGHSAILRTLFLPIEKWAETSSGTEKILTMLLIS